MTRLRKTLLALTLSIALVAGLSAPTFSDEKDDVKREQRKNEQKLKDAQEEVQESTKAARDAKRALDRASARLSVAETKLGQTRGKLAVAQAEDARLRAELDKAEAELRSAEARLEAAEKELKQSRGAVESFAVEQVMAGDTGLKAFGDLLRGADPGLFSEQMSAKTSIGDAQVAVMQELAASEVMLGIERDKVERLRDQVADQKRQAEAVVVQMQALTAQAQAQAASVAQLVSARAGAKRTADATLVEDLKLQAELEADRVRLENQLAEIVRKELAAAAAAAARARKKNKGNGGSGGGGGSSNSGGGGSGTGDSGGALSRPVPGPITSPYGMRRHPITGVYKLHDGTDFGVGCGVPIRAAAGGRIVSQYYNGGYGNRVILNNGVKRGVSVITTYNHLSRYAKSTGAKVSRGDIIGYVGSTGYSTGCHLHFMVLVNGRTTQPMNWL
ncbi:peptidoglycan DD-metalloendopeptidase family protein [Aeromicrobium sp. 636]|uniref:Peptidoglycan DD-metalloendopeptidase family protein n=1 Tax=Aeromicrobium senzhongii TaxID=2663859 RepID=A0A8I0EVF2_9ACTN|nr:MULTISPECIES: M23 family metallopeptidase [Aeromicrobium]MBC9226338.1 peptidoglycan DD-metalloendopeptidase family protein [Aeromicrobium senzhongii]MCQ3998443.1 peptidoglycan DD-metalloendopeptidase family protein [Aeromicrobium sp. 636]